MITADPNSALGFLCRLVDSMNPGDYLDIDYVDMMDIPPYWHNGALFTPADRVLGNIVGSAYTHSYRERPGEDGVTFIRHENTGERRSMDPDRR